MDQYGDSIEFLGEVYGEARVGLVVPQYVTIQSISELEASFDEILENVKQRDYIDQNRAVSPLRKAEDALLLDNTDLSIEEQKKWLFEQFNKVSK